MKEEKLIAKIFQDCGVEGTFLISSNDSRNFLHNEVRANQRFTPASTFKILNSLIALEEKIISTAYDVIKWNGYSHEYPNWNRDQTLETAFKYSCVWFYQELARKISPDKYRKYIRELSYGVLKDSFEQITFWLDGSLEISAVEQVEFLKKVYHRLLSFKPSSYETLKQIMIVEQSAAFTLRAKTGWSKGVGWYVGHVEASNDVWFFALNIDVKNKEDLPLRQKLMSDVFEALGILN